MKKAVVLLKKSFFESGQAYVALSRVRHLEDLTIWRYHPSAILILDFCRCCSNVSMVSLLTTTYTIDLPPPPPKKHHHTVQVAQVYVWYLRQWVEGKTPPVQVAMGKPPQVQGESVPMAEGETPPP